MNEFPVLGRCEDPGSLEGAAVFAGWSPGSRTATSASGPPRGGGCRRGAARRVAAQDRTKVRVMGVTVDPQRGLELWDLWKQQIEEANPDIEVEFITPVPGINTEKLLTMVATGDAPEVIQGSSVEFAARGLLVDLTPFIERDGILT